MKYMAAILILLLASCGEPERTLESTPVSESKEALAIKSDIRLNDFPNNTIDWNICVARGTLVDAERGSNRLLPI
jgi:hypothetical protein